MESRDWPLVGESKSDLYTAASDRERVLELGKVQNLRLVCSRLDGLVFEPGQVFSFWNQVGRCTRRRGYVLGRQLQEGCVVPAIGGGICQITNALYSLALKGKFEILERHPHTRAFPGSALAEGSDATVAFSHIDLRFRADWAFQLSARMTASELIVGIHAAERRPSMKLLPLLDGRKGASGACDSCGETGCFQHKSVSIVPSATKVAWLVDEWMPEYAQIEEAKDLLLLPLDGRLRGKAHYAWPVDDFASVRESRLLTYRRSLELRRVSEQGSARQQAMLEASRRLAAQYAARLPIESRHLIVSQTLLPFLWEICALGGRTFDVLMSRLPMAEIQGRLDREAERQPERKLLSDFRAPDPLVLLESKALEAAASHYTPHSDIAAHVERPAMLTWIYPRTTAWTKGGKVVFPGPTVARKGAYEVRDAALALDLEIVTLGSELEGPGFWSGVKQSRRMRKENWLEGALAVVQPALLEDKPRALLAALEAGCPVIATKACGVSPRKGLTLLASNDPTELQNAIRFLTTA